MMREIPSLDELCRAPEKAAELPPDAALALHTQCLTALHALCARLLTAHAAGRETPAPTDILLGPDEVAAMIGMSASWVEKHTRDLPPRVSVAGNPRWRKSDVETWIKARPVYGKSP